MLPVLIRGGGFVNKGGEAMLLTVMNELRARIPDVTFAFAPESVSAGNREKLKQQNIATIKPLTGSYDQLVGLGRRIAAKPWSLGKLVRSRKDWLSYDLMTVQVSAILDIRGFAYGDAWGPSKSWIGLKFTSAARRLGRPYIFLPQAWGPFSTPQLRNPCKSMCENADLLYSRDSMSTQHVSSLAESLAGKVQTYPDIAFRFRQNESLNQQEVLSRFGVPDTGRNVAIVPNMKVYERTSGTGAANLHCQQLAAACRSVIRKGYTAILLPHEIRPGRNGTIDDRILCSLVAEQFDRSAAYPVLEYLNAAEAKVLISSCKATIASRFHAIVGSLSMGIPAFVLGWSHKYKALMGDFGLEHLAIDLDSNSSVDGVDSAVCQFVDELDGFSECINERLGTIKSKVDELFDTVAETVSSA